MYTETWGLINNRNDHKSTVKLSVNLRVFSSRISLWSLWVVRREMEKCAWSPVWTRGNRTGDYIFIPESNRFCCFFFSVVSLSLKFHIMFWHVVATRKIVHIFWHLKGKSRHVDNLVEIIFKLIGSHVSTEWTKAKLCGCVPFLLTFPCGEFFLSSLSRNFHFEEHAGKLQIKQL